MNVKIDVMVDAQRNAFAMFTVSLSNQGSLESHIQNITPYDDPRKMLIDVHVSAYEEPRESDQVYAAVMHDIRGKLDLGILPAGKKYALRVNGNNDLVRWFEVD